MTPWAQTISTTRGEKVSNVNVCKHHIGPIADRGVLRITVVLEMGDKFGKTFAIWEQSAEKIRNAGFVDVTVVDYKWPMNGWPTDAKAKEIGRWNQLRLMDGVEGFMLRLLTQVGGVSGSIDGIVCSANCYSGQLQEHSFTLPRCGKNSKVPALTRTSRAQSSMRESL